MPQTSIRAVALSILLAGGAFVSTSYAAQTLERRAQQPAPVQPSAAQPVARDMDAEATRERLIEVLRKHPPAVARVLKLDPSLMHNESYLAAYPSLREFLAQHPEIPQNASYYLENFHVNEGNWQPRNQRMEMVENTIAGLAAFTACAIVLGTLIWLVKTILEQRRWSRLSKIQAEVHSKLMDRFSSNDELLTYVQTPSGKRFLESGPSPLEEGPPKTMGAPFARILWSVQIGIVLLVAGLGLLYVSTRTIEEAREFFFISGALAMALGAGFTVSAGASYVLSRKLGLFDRPTADHA
jgi:hypothetical protein